MALSNAVTLALIGTLASLFMLGVQAQGLGSADFLHLQPRVIGGAEVRDRCKAPFNSIVALQFESSTGPVIFCSAVMLTETILVSSAFCVDQFLLLGSIPKTAVIGERDMLMSDVAEQKIPVASVVLHPNYNGTTFDNNIGLIRLQRAAQLGPCVKPAFKMEADPTACTDIDKSCLMVGWGPYAETSLPTNSRLPRYGSVSVYGDLVTALLSRAERGGDQPVGSLYAEAINTAVKACFFDWGGMISCLRNGNYVLRGVIGEHNCNSLPVPPILMTDIPYFQTWIDTCIADWASCSPTS